MSSLGHCMSCGAPTYSRNVWCRSCYEKYGALGRQYSDWPEWLKVYYLDCRREQDADRRLLKRLVEASPWLDQLLYGEFNDDESYDITEPAGRDEAGLLRCCRCKHIYVDAWQTWPLPVAWWTLPTCPICGSDWYEEYHGRDSRRGHPSTAEIKNAIATVG